MSKTQKFYEYAKIRIPGGVQLLSKRPEQFAPEQWPAYFTKARGCEVWDLDDAVEKVGAEKIFFGTDTYACGFQMGRIKYARISDKDKESILYNNAKICFKRQFELI